MICLDAHKTAGNQIRDGRPRIFLTRVGKHRHAALLTNGTHNLFYLGILDGTRGDTVLFEEHIPAELIIRVVFRAARQRLHDMRLVDARTLGGNLTDLIDGELFARKLNVCLLEAPSLPQAVRRAQVLRLGNDALKRTRAVGRSLKTIRQNVDLLAGLGIDSRDLAPRKHREVEGAIAETRYRDR